MISDIYPDSALVMADFAEFLGRRRPNAYSREIIHRGALHLFETHAQFPEPENHMTLPISLSL